MKHLTIEVPADTDSRIDVFLCQSAEVLTRSAAQRLLDSGAVLVNGVAAKKNHRLTGGERLTVCLPAAVPTDVLPQNIPLDVICEDSDVIVINKPVGMVVHPAAGHPDNTLVNALLYHCGDSLSGIGGVLRPGIVHRLDRDTSGLILAAKNDAAHLHLAAQLKNHTLKRAYEAIACGQFKEDAGVIRAAIGRHPTDRKRMAVRVKAGKEAVTHWQVIARYMGYTHLLCHLETGRTHQIRVHMASLGHPLLGDPVYGPKRPQLGLAGQCLHARRLTFLHPRTNVAMQLECPLPDFFQNVLTKLRPLL